MSGLGLVNIGTPCSQDQVTNGANRRGSAVEDLPNKIFVNMNKIFVNMNKIFVNMNKIFVNMDKIFVNMNKIFVNINKIFVNMKRPLLI